MIEHYTLRELPAKSQITGKRMKYAPLHLLAKWCEVRYNTVYQYFDKPSVKWHAVKINGRVYASYDVMHRFKTAKELGLVLKDAERVHSSYDELKELRQFERDAEMYSGVQTHAKTTAEYVNEALMVGVV